MTASACESPTDVSDEPLGESAHINAKVKQTHDVSQPTPDQKMKIDSSASNIDIIKVDTSGAKFERQANLRRSQRLSSSTVRQRSNAAQRRQLRHKHKTLTGLPGNITAEISDSSAVRPYSLHSDANGTGSSFVEGVSSDDSRSVINGHIVVSPGQNQKNAEIQTDDVKVIPLTPSQRRMRQKGIRSNHASPASSHGSTEFLASPTAVPCPTVPMMKQTSTPINGVHDKELIRPNTLDVKNNDTSTDEGRHTGESNPPTPVRNGTPQDLSASPHLKPSPSPPMTTEVNNGNHGNGNVAKPEDITMRVNGARTQQGEERASSGFWSGTESVQHSSSSDITMQHAPVVNALQHMLKDRQQSPIFSNSVGQISPIVNNRPLVSSSAISSSSVSVNSKLSTLDVGTSNASLFTLDDDRFQSPSSSVISVTLNKSNNNSTLSLNSCSEGGTPISAKAMMKRSRKAATGAYNFMNYESDLLERESDGLSRAVKNRRSGRSLKLRGGSKKKLTPEDAISLTSIPDSSPQNTDPDAHSAHSGGILTNDTTSLCDSMFSVDQEGYYTSMHEDCGISRSAPPCTASNITEPVTLDVQPVTPTPAVIPVEVKPASPIAEQGTEVFSGDELKQAIEARTNSNYNSYNRAVKSNHSTPKSLLSPRGKSASVKSPKPVEPPAIDFQSELNKRLSLRRTSGKKSPVRKEKRGAPPPPPKRASSLSGSSSPSPSLSHKSLPDKEFSPTVPSPSSPHLSAGSPSQPTPQQVPIFPEAFYMETLAPPPPVDAFPPPPPPPEIQTIQPKTSLKSPETKAKPPPPPKPCRTTSMRSRSLLATSPKPVAQSTPPKSPNSPKSPVDNSSPYYSIAMQAAALGNRRAESKKSTANNKPKVEVKVKTATEEKVVVNSPTKEADKKAKSELDDAIPVLDPIKIQQVESSKPSEPENSQGEDVPDGKSQVSKGSGLANIEDEKPTAKIPPPTAPKTASVPPVSKIPPVVSPKPFTPSKDSSFESKRTREQSPSYRASLARAAFFASVAAPQPPVAPKLEKAPPVAPKPDKVPLVASIPENEEKAAKVQDAPKEKEPQGEVVEENNEIESSPNEEKKTVDVEESNAADDDAKVAGEVQETTFDQNQSETKTDTSGTDETPEIPKTETSDSNDWLGQIEELSAPNSAQNSTTVAGETAEQDSAASRLGIASTKQTPKFSTYDNLMAAIHKSKRETLSGKPAGASPPSSPGVTNEVFAYRTGASSTNGNKSPGSTLERKRNGRLSSNGHRNGISRKSNGSTSRDDFKALLLQNACRGSSGSQMTAAEKLQLHKPQLSATSALSRQRPYSMTEIEKATPQETDQPEDEENSENSRPMLSLNDIRSAITSGSATTRQGRTNRRGPRVASMDLSTKYATFSVHGKKHPPPSFSSKYNTRSRTPTRPMMSISEDSETEKSPEQSHARSKLQER